MATLVQEHSSFPGLSHALHSDVEPYTEQALTYQLALHDDLSAERETVIPDKRTSQFRNSLGSLKSTLSQAAQSVTNKTEADYRSLAKRFYEWLLENKFVLPDNKKWGQDPCEEMPELICGFIMQECDGLDFKTGLEKPAKQRRSGFTTAQKMRAALTHLFGITFALGNIEWHRDAATGRMVGNPSISSLVSRYMIGLQRRKVQAGEAPTAARAITSRVMRKLYVLNRRLYGPSQADDLRARLLQCAYTLAFICLLRFDEVLRIQMQDLTFHADGSVELRLPFRKTDKKGNITPFVLWRLEADEAHLCPVRALCEWLDASGIRKGYLFPKLTADRSRPKVVTGKAPEHMVRVL
ncbi:hypothetical protein BD626DRAFT_564873 [Schizophyllum amplum]|uniref:Tyr recombinase domain-containing protein n=1 Tax=Schizophyllum amplum TaxID=97359 RepID=A0A550CT76_9AGAR|nr:hypothetical protein BD626DRAFT_564873 [Auriculariopsis ampla]